VKPWVQGWAIALLVTFAVLILAALGVVIHISNKLSKIHAAREPETIIYEETSEPFH
jgi:hypothetical protein